MSALLLPSCGGGGGGPTTPLAAPTQATIAVAFVGAPPAGGAPGFRSVLLNISAVRVNHSPSQSISGPGWVTIPVPSGAANGRGASGGDLQIDLNQIQTQATIFNLGGVPTNTYEQLQVVVDPNNPGTIVPACQSAGAGQEGCVSYPVALSDPTHGIVIQLNNFKVSKFATAPLLIRLSATIVGTPTGTGGAYVLEINPTVANASSFLGTISGTVNAQKGSHALHLRPLSVTAELAGTSTIVETALVRGNTYTLELPAAPGPGTTYDLYVSGGSQSIAVAPGITIQPGGFINDQNFTVKSVQNGKFNGQITDACTGSGIPGATLNLLVPTDPTVDCGANPAQCVIAGSASADQSGFYPIPGNISNPSPFVEIPAGTNFGFQLGISATGYNSTIQPAEVQSPTRQNCLNSFNKANCSFSLSTGVLNGTVTLAQAPPAGNSVQVQVFAETHATNQLVSALPMPIVFQSGNISAPFTMNLPVGAGTFDLFAVAIDPYLGGPGPYPGHTIPTVSGVAGITGACGASADNPSLGLDCVGHGSISGTVSNPDPGTTIQVEDASTKVLILGTPPGLLSSAAGAPNNQYALCIPPGSYTVQRFEGSTPGPSQNVAVPVPQATATPCPSTCFSDSAGTSCPGQCVSTFANF